MASAAILGQNGIVNLVVGFTQGIWEGHQAFSYGVRGMHFAEESDLESSKLEPTFIHQVGCIPALK